MNLRLLAFIAIFTFYSGLANCSIQDDVTYISTQFNQYNLDLKSDTDNLNKEIVNKNINFLETFVLKALKKAKIKVEKYQNKLVNLKQEFASNKKDFYDEEDYYNYIDRAENRILKKIESIESRVHRIEEILFGIQFLKLRLSY